MNSCDNFQYTVVLFRPNNEHIHHYILFCRLYFFKQNKIKIGKCKK